MLYNDFDCRIIEIVLHIGIMIMITCETFIKSVELMQKKTVYSGVNHVEEQIKLSRSN